MSLVAISTVHARVFYGGGSPTSETLRHVWSKPISNKIESLAANRLIVEILHISKRSENWDGFGSAQPIATAVTNAVNAASSFVQQVSLAGLEWSHPFIGSNEVGEISFEWWCGDKKLTIYIGSDEINFVSSWGHNIDSHMDAGQMATDDFLKQWRWLKQLHN